MRAPAVLPPLVALSVACGLAFGLAGAAGAATVRFDRIDERHSAVRFRIPVWGGLSEISCRFVDYSMTIDWDSADPTRSSVTARIATASLASGARHRDERLRSTEFFDVARYPEIVFRSSAVERHPSGFVAKGELAMHGVTKPIELKFAIVEAAVGAEPRELSLAIQAASALDREAFGIGGRGDRPPFVGSEATLEIRLLTLPAAGAGEATP